MLRRKGMSEVVHDIWGCCGVTVRLETPGTNNCYMFVAIILEIVNTLMSLVDSFAVSLHRFKYYMDCTSCC